MAEDGMPARLTHDTPWGAVAVYPSPASRGPDGSRSDEFLVDTPHGKARASLHADYEGDEPPTLLRIVLSCGYAGPMAPPADLARDSSLSVGGAVVGWRVQAYLDPVSGEPVKHGSSGAILVDKENKMLRGFHATERNLRDRVWETLQAACEADPSYAPRVFAAMMRDVVSDLDVDLAAAEREAETIRLRRDRAAETLDKAKWAATWAEQASAGPSGP